MSAPILSREREISLEHEQRCSFLIMEQSCGPHSVELFPGKHCDFSTYLAQRGRAQSGKCADVLFPDYGTVLWAQGSRIYSREELRLQNLFSKECESTVGACAEVQFPDNGTEIWSRLSRNVSRKALRFQHLICQGSESSVWRMRRGAFS
jgi:hypothetical protein